MRLLLAALSSIFLCVVAVSAQDADVTVRPQVLVIDPERVYAESERGQAIRAELDAIAAEVQAENDRIVQDLIAEEQDLAAQ